MSAVQNLSTDAPRTRKREVPAAGAGQERPHKRRRAMSDSYRYFSRDAPVMRFGAPHKVQRDSEFWFEDGSIVLLAYGDVAFKVYKRILSEHSALFRDMFSIPQSPKVPMVDGCPYTYVSEYPSHMRHLLRILFPTKGSLAFGKPPDGLSMDTVCAVITLSHKFQIDQLVSQGLAHLTEYYTNDFDLWCETDRSTCLEPEPIDAIRAINIARLTGTTSILPLAYLHASRAGATILRGCAHGEGYVEGLPLAELMRILDGRAELIRRASTALVRIFRPEVSDLCGDERRCLRHLAGQALRLDDVLDDLYEEGFAQSWVHLVNLKDEDGTSPWKLCRACLEMVEDRDREERRRFWNDLPGVFGLKVDGWEA